MLDRDNSTNVARKALINAAINITHALYVGQLVVITDNVVYIMRSCRERESDCCMRYKFFFQHQTSKLIDHTMPSYILTLRTCLGCSSEHDLG